MFPSAGGFNIVHSVGLLRGSFRPPDVICAIRSLWRHRDCLIQMAAQHVMHMQKSLDQMNLQLHHVLSEITGLSGQRILDAILAGERDPTKLPRYATRMKSSQDIVTRALRGDYRSEHLFDTANGRLAPSAANCVRPDYGE
jgi:transposase